MDFRKDRVGIIIPAYNSELYLTQTLYALLKVYPASKIVVVDDGSTDKTKDRALRLGVHCLRHPINEGKGSALMTGILWAQEQGMEWVITMDADGQHSPLDLPLFLNAKIHADTGIIVGRRKISGTSMPLHRRFSNYFTTDMISILAGRPIFDAQCGFRMYRLASINRSRLPRFGRFEWEAQALVLMCRGGYSIQAVDIETVYTDNGSHMDLFLDTLRFLKMVGKFLWML